MKYFLYLSVCIIALCSCNGISSPKEEISADSLFQQIDSLFAKEDEYSDTVVIKYAKGLQVNYRRDGVHVFISNPDPSVKHGKSEEIIVKEPSDKFICTTALQLGNFEILGLENYVVGMNSLKNLFAPNIKKQIRDGRTKMIGKEGNFDIETVIAMKPDYIFVSASKHGGFEALKECGIPLISHHGYKETNPLGQAEWIKLIGLLTGNTRRANAVFADIEKKYLKLKHEVERLDSINSMQSIELPTVASGRQVRDGWYIVGGKSYMAQIFKDSGAKYVMSDNDDSGGTTLDFEAAFAKSVDADYWQLDGTYDGDFTLAVLSEDDVRYSDMKAYKQRNVIFCNFSQTPYRELSPVEPHIILADFVKVFHPEILPHYSPKYYKKIHY